MVIKHNTTKENERALHKLWRDPPETRSDISGVQLAGTNSRNISGIYHSNGP
jgi:hypothetical protein